MNTKLENNKTISAKICFISIFLLFTIFLAACGNNEPSISPEDEKNKTEQAEKVKNIDFDKLDKETAADFLKDSKFNQIIKDISFFKHKRTDDEKESIYLAAIVDDNINKQNLLDLCDYMLKNYGEHVHKNYPSLAGPSQGYYGEIFDIYDAYIVISPESDPKNKTYISTYIPAEMHTKRTISPDKDFYNYNWPNRS